MRRRSVIELAERCAWEADHSRQVAAIALTLFDYTKRIHMLGDREREWLEYAGFLHDIGNHISYEKHHRHSYYLIKNGDLRGFEPEEIDVIALVTRYHRRATPKSRSPRHVGCQQGTTVASIEVLSAFLRLAETLDRSRHGVIRGLEVRERLGEIRIKRPGGGRCRARSVGRAQAGRGTRGSARSKSPHREGGVPQRAEDGEYRAGTRAPGARRQFAKRRA